MSKEPTSNINPDQVLAWVAHYKKLGGHAFVVEMLVAYADLLKSAVEPTAQPRERETDFQIALVQELADVKQSLLATQGRLETSQKMLGNCHKELMTDTEAAPPPIAKVEPAQPLKRSVTNRCPKCVGLSCLCDGSCIKPTKVEPTAQPESKA